MARFVSFKENKSKIVFEVIDCIADIINKIVDEMCIYYKENNIDTLITIDKRLDFHYEKIKKCIYVTENKVLETPLNSHIIYISMYDNTIKSGKLIKILNKNKYLVQQGNRHLNVFLDAYYVFYERFIKSKFRNTLGAIKVCILGNMT